MAEFDAIVLSSDDENLSALAEDRPPSEDDISSCTISDSESETDEGLSDSLDEETLDNPTTNGDAHDLNLVQQTSGASAENVNGTVDSRPKIDEDEANTGDKKKKSPRKKRVKKQTNGSEEGKEVKSKKKRTKKSSHNRKNIRGILEEEKLKTETLNAQKEEEERRIRLAERNNSATDAPNLVNLLTVSSRPPKTPIAPSFQLTPSSMTVGPHRRPDVVELLSSSDEEDRECIVLSDPQSPVDDVDDEGTGADDPENSGSHVDDALNRPDADGRVLINVRHPAAEDDVFLAPQIAAVIKPHQIGGIRFLYDNLIESQSRLSTSPGFGCILAHSMGLGKTIQVVSFTEIFMRVSENLEKKTRVLIIVPINTLQNWVNEFDMWLPTQNKDDGSVSTRRFSVRLINDTHKTIGARAAVISKWTEEGGVLLIGYEMFRLLATRKTRQRKRKANAGPELIDIDLEEKKSEMQCDMQVALLNPGPDLVICDEGHRIKNSHASTSKSLKEIHTKRRVVLTGYPLQNNLIEYWCMVDFVRPNFLGTRVEFSNMFERPISNGQCADSTYADVKLMKYRSHVLHSLLEGFVQRRNHKVLQASLPEKEEWVLLIKMSPFQRQIYNLFMEDLKASDTDNCLGGTNPLKAFAVACKIWNHPDVLQRFLDARTDNDLEVDDSSSSTALENGGNSGNKKMKKSTSEPNLKRSGGDLTSVPSMSNIYSEKAEISYDWVKPSFEKYPTGMLENSGKFVLLFDIIKLTLGLGERLLVFSQSLMTLNLLEDLLSRTPVPSDYLDGECWSKGRTYFRLDGSTNASDREKLISQFNSPNNRYVNLFLLSTKAGCLGINLVGANRVVMLDASWNPCHDCQAVCRVYRYGQTRPCFIYRLVTDNTMERKIYERQIAKQGMADRVVDEMQVTNQFTKKENEQLLEYQDKELEGMDASRIDEVCFDPVLNPVIKQHHAWVTQSPFTHESLLIEHADDKLSSRDKKLAREAYEREKKLSASFSRPSYSNFYKNRLPVPKLPPVFRGPSMPEMARPQTPTPVPYDQGSLQFRAALAPGAVRHIRPGVSVKVVRASKDIVPPGSDGNIIRKGDPVTVISTPKGIYIKLDNGKIFAVRSRADSEAFGITPNDETSVPSPSPAGASVPDMFSCQPAPMSNSTIDTPLTSVLQRSSNFTPNVSARRPRKPDLPQEQPINIIAPETTGMEMNFPPYMSQGYQFGMAENMQSQPLGFPQYGYGPTNNFMPQNFQPPSIYNNTMNGPFGTLNGNFQPGIPFQAAMNHPQNPGLISHNGMGDMQNNGLYYEQQPDEDSDELPPGLPTMVADINEQPPASSNLSIDIG